MKKPKKRPVSFASRLKLLGACEEAVKWCGNRALAAAWRECPRADWMFWLLERIDGWSRDALNACLLDIMADALESARAVAGKEAYWAQVETAHRQVRDAIAGRGDLVAAGAAAEAAAWAAAEAAAEAAARAAAWAAARAARAAAEAAAEAAAGAAAEAAAWAAARAARAAAGAAANQRLADIVRKHFPQAPKIKETTK